MQNVAGPRKSGIRVFFLSSPLPLDTYPDERIRGPPACCGAPARCGLLLSSSSLLFFLSSASDHCMAATTRAQSISTSPTHPPLLVVLLSAADVGAGTILALLIGMRRLQQI